MSKEYTDPFALTRSLIPATIGFDRLFSEFNNVANFAKNATGYPPYNIKKISENHYILELAVAGFAKQDIDIELDGSHLIVKGNTTIDTLTKDGTEIQYLWKGIAERAFKREFSLSDTMTIKNAELINGILKIWLENMIPAKSIKKIEINQKDQKDNSVQEFLTEKYGK